MPRRLLPALLLAVLAVSGCGDVDEERLRERAEQLRDDVRADVEQLTDDLTERTAEARREARRVGEDLARQVREALDDLERTVPRAGPQTRPPSSAAGQATPGTIDALLEDSLKSIDRYWTRTFAENGLPEPRVRYVFVPDGQRGGTGCGEPADDVSAFYCPADDTIYVGRRIASDVFSGVADGFPGQSAGSGRAVGDFGVAYIVAHEYAHNLQQELGYFSAERVGASARPFELQADCLAGVWGASVYRAGLLEPGDVEEALGTALAVGDFEVGSRQHHGTPEERRDAWLLGFDSGAPKTCQVFIQP